MLNTITKQTVKAIAIISAVIMLLGWAGSMDYASEIVYNMPQEAYEAITLKLGDGCTDRQIAAEYIDNKEFYDSLSY